ncbi:MAG: DeoR family transcriptional regulator, partial [Candidatus Aenigmarchaeota archaeon]|nr:DeoR family transcriptional regulator [Candidatus Aenigmarchaeota archaeon]
VNAPKYKLDINNKYFGMEFYKSMDYLKRTDLNVPVNVLLNVPVNNRQNELLELLSSAKFTINKLSVKLNVADKTIKRDLKKLIDLKFVERIGSDKSGYYWIKIKAEK